MADISIKGLNQFFGENQILHDITFDIFPGEKVAIVGPNGAGKTTLFRVITGELPYETGTISIAKNRTVGVIDQIPVYEPGDTVEQILRSAFHRIAEVRQRMTELEMQMEKNDDSQILKQYGALQAEFEAMGGYALDYEVDKVCNGLEIPKEMRAQPFDVLSGGEKTRVNLARIILEDTDILLLDEPTNHLDLDAVEWLGNFLSEYKGTVVTISHDRYFLDSAVTASLNCLKAMRTFMPVRTATMQRSASCALHSAWQSMKIRWRSSSDYRINRARCTSGAPRKCTSVRSPLISASRA